MTHAHPDPTGTERQNTQPTPDASQAFETLVRTHYSRLCAFALRLTGSREVAEDVVHDVLLRIWRERERFEFRDPLAYLYRSVRNGVTSDRRRHAVRGRLLGEMGDGDATLAHSIHGTPGPDVAAVVEGHDLARAAARAVDALPERCRLIFTMRREQGLSYGEIARVLDLSVKTVENQMTRAAKLLRARLANYL